MVFKKLTLTAIAVVMLVSTSSLSKPSQPKSRNRLMLEDEVKKYLGVYNSKEDMEVGDNPLGLIKRYHYNSKDSKKYETWIKRCTKNNVYCLVVDKAARKLEVHKNKNKIKSYPVELGANPYDDKQKRGDFCTPEGTYKFKVNSGTRFHKALHINYPNKEDRKKGKTGSLIEIHGSGGNSYDWTAGCVALSNKNIDDLFKTIKPRRNRKKTGVVIVKYGTQKKY